MSSTIHTILGAGGASGAALLDVLQSRSLTVRAVTKNSFVASADEHRRADLTSPEAARSIIAGNHYVYLCVGLPYRTKTWVADWERVIHNAIEGCLATGAKLIFR